MLVPVLAKYALQQLSGVYLTMKCYFPETYNEILNFKYKITVSYSNKNIVKENIYVIFTDFAMFLGLFLFRLPRAIWVVHSSLL